MNSDPPSEESGPSSFSTASVMMASSTAPSMDETLFQPQLFYAFLKFLAMHKAQENLVFMKHTYLFTLLQRPIREKYMAASKIVWNFLCESSPNPVNLSAETLKKLQPVVWDRNGISLIKQDMFIDAFNEVKRMLNPLFSSWIAAGEWNHIPFFHAQPPSAQVIIKVPSLRDHFDAFLKTRSEAGGEDAEMDCKLFKTITELYEIVADSKNPEITAKEVERKARHYIRSHKAELQAFPNMDEVEVPQNLHHKKRQTSSNLVASAQDDTASECKEDDNSPSCVDYVTEALDVLTEELSERECYDAFVEERNWDPMEAMKASLQQTHDRDGNVEYPSLAAVLHSPTYGPLVTNTFKDTDKFDQMRFLLEAHEYYAHFRDTNKKKNRSGNKKEMQIEARRLFDRFIAKNNLGLPKSVKAEITACVFSISAKKISPLVFQRAGSWIYNRIARSWIREVNTLLLWVDHDFDNNSPIVLEMEQLYNIAHIPDLDLKLVPHPDDVISNPELFDSFRKFVPQNDFNKRCLEFVRSAKNLSAISPESLMIEVQSLVSQLKNICKDAPELSAMQAEIESHAINLSTFNPQSFAMPCHMVLKILLEQYYNPWITKCKSAYKKGTWTPAKSLTFFGNESISGTSCIPSIGMSASVSKKPTLAPSIKDKKRWGFSPFSKGKPPSPSSGSIPSPTSPSASSSPLPRKASIGSSSSPVSKEPTGSNEILLCKSRDNAISDDEMGPSHHSGINLRLPNSVVKSMPKFVLEVPTIQETLASTHLRRMFYGTFLEMRLGDEEKVLWNDFCKFHKDFVCWTDAELTSRQKEICDAAMKLLDEHPQIPLHDDLVKSIKESRYTVTSHFFFEAENKLYGQFHAYYQSFLLNNRWVSHNPSTPGSNT